MTPQQESAARYLIETELPRVAALALVAEGAVLGVNEIVTECGLDEIVDFKRVETPRDIRQIRNVLLQAIEAGA